MRKIISLAVILAVATLLLLVTAAPVLAAPPGKTTIVAPSIGGPDGSVKDPVAMVPDKSTHPVFETNPAFGGTYPGAGEPGTGTPGKVFWSGVVW